MDTPLVSIIVPLYRYERFIVDCLISCVNQDYPNVEIIVVDDSSPDRSVEMAEKIRDSRIKIIQHVENRGYSAAKNTGIRNAQGKYIRFIDADDCITPVGVSKLVTAMEKDPCDLVHGIAYKVDGGPGYGKMLVKQRKYPFDRRCVIHAQGLLYPRNTFEKYGLFYEQLRSKADKEYHERLRLCGAKIRGVLSKVAFYRIHDSSMLAMRNRNKGYDNMVTSLYHDRVKQIKKEGLTKENTLWLEGRSY